MCPDSKDFCSKEGTHPQRLLFIPPFGNRHICNLRPNDDEGTRAAIFHPS